MTKINAVILTRTTTPDIYQTTLQCIESMIANANAERFTLAVTVVESAAQPLSDYPQWINTIHPDEPFNFHRFLNIGIESASDADWHLLCNNDLLFETDWLRQIEYALDEFPQLMSLSPLSPTCREQREFYEQRGERKVALGYTRRRELSGWCIMVARQAMQTTGPLDERFSFYFADDDYALTLRRFNILHALVTNSLVYHLEDRKISAQDPAGEAVAPPLPYLKKEKYHWITKNKGMLDGFLIYQKKWGDYRIIRLKRKIHDIALLRFKIRFLSSLLFRPAK